jgi:hypothetical protein
MSHNSAVISIVPELTTEGTEHLLGNLTGKIVANIEVRASWQAEAGLTADNEDMEFNGSNRTITWNLGNFELEEFFEGDSIIIGGTTSNNGDYVIESIKDGEIKTTTALTTETSETALITGRTLCTGVNFRWGVIPNDAADSFISLQDGNENKYSLGGLVALDDTTKDAIQQGVYKSNHNGSLTVTGKDYCTAQANAVNDMVFVGSTKTITWTAEDFEAVHFEAGEVFEVLNTASNNGTYTVASVSFGVLTTVEGLTNETSTTATVRTEHRNEYIFAHTFYIDPLFLLEQLSDLEADTAPEYLLDINTLRYYFEVELLYDLNDPNKKHVVIPEVPLLGNVGWFNENLNQGIPNYAVSSVVMTDPSGNVVPYADYQGVTDVVMQITSVNSVFTAYESPSNTGTEFVVNHFILQESEDDYINTATDLQTNFMWDRAKQKIGNSGINGDGFGTGKQVITDIICQTWDSTNATIEFKINPSAEYQLRLAAMVDRKMILSITVGTNTLTTINSDVCAIRLGEEYYDTDLSNPSVGGVSTVFNPYPDTSISDANAGEFIEDTLIGRSIIRLDRANSALIEDVKVEIYATNGTDSFTLSEKNLFRCDYLRWYSGYKLIRK